MVGNSCSNWSMGEPPKLTKDNFMIWKNRMILFLNCINSDILTIIKEGPYVPQVFIPGVPAFVNAPAIPAKYQDKERKHWTADDIEKVALEHKAKHIIVMSIPDDIYRFVIHCKTAKEIWDSLVIFFEGTDEVKEHKVHLLVRQIEVFTSKPGEPITETYCRFNYLLNDLKQHNKVFDDEYVVEKFLKSLPREWSFLSMVIRDSKNFKTMSLQTRYGKLWSYELRSEMGKLSVIQEKQTENKVVVKDAEYYKAKYLKLKAKNDAGNKRSTEVDKVIF